MVMLRTNLHIGLGSPSDLGSLRCYRGAHSPDRVFVPPVKRTAADARPRPAHHLLTLVLARNVEERKVDWHV